MKVDLKTLPYEPACFAGGTLVHTKNGLVPIEQIQVGDWVLSKHEGGEGEREYKRVTKTFVHEDREVIRIACGGNECYQNIIVTPEHPIWVQGKGWRAANKIKPTFPVTRLELLAGEPKPNVAANLRLFVTNQTDVAWCPSSSVASDLGSKVSIIDIRTLGIVERGVIVGIEYVENTHRAKPEHLFRTTVYNIEVEDFHTYYVGKAGIWVHNKNIRTATMK